MFLADKVLFKTSKFILLKYIFKVMVIICQQSIGVRGGVSLTISFVVKKRKRELKFIFYEV